MVVTNASGSGVTAMWYHQSSRERDRAGRGRDTRQRQYRCRVVEQANTTDMKM